MSGSRITFKISDGSPQLRRVTLDGPSLNYQTLMDTLATLFPNLLANYVVSYIDEEGDFISIRSEIEFSECIRSAELNSRHLALPTTVVRLQVLHVLEASTGSFVPQLSASLIPQLPPPQVVLASPQQRMPAEISASASLFNTKTNQSSTAMSVLSTSACTASTVIDWAQATVASIQSTGDSALQISAHVRDTVLKSQASHDETKASIEVELAKLRQVTSHQSQSSETQATANQTTHNTLEAAAEVMASIANL